MVANHHMAITYKDGSPKGGDGLPAPFTTAVSRQGRRPDIAVPVMPASSLASPASVYHFLSSTSDRSRRLFIQHLHSAQTFNGAIQKAYVQKIPTGRQLSSACQRYRQLRDRFSSSAILRTFSPVSLRVFILRTASRRISALTLFTAGENSHIRYRVAVLEDDFCCSAEGLLRSFILAYPSAIILTCRSGSSSPLRIRLITLSRHLAECSALASGTCFAIPQRSRYSLTDISCVIRRCGARKENALPHSLQTMFPRVFRSVAITPPPCRRRIPQPSR